MKHLLLLLLFVAAGMQTAHAQSEAYSTVLNHLRGRQAELGLVANDLADVAVTDEYVSRRNGISHVYLRQKVNGVEVYNARASAHVTPNGRVVSVHSTFVADAANRTASPTATAPSLTVEAAVEAAAHHLGLSMTGAPSVIEPADARHRMLLSDAGVSLEPIPAQLVYFVTESGTLRLAWDLAIYQKDARHWWSLRVDAESGAVLDQNDWVVQDSWVPEDGAPQDYRPLAPSPITQARASGSYNVWAMPLESPNHGPRTLEVTPHDPDFSPSGWHDDGTTTYTITRGNNVYAYEDRSATNTPGYSPDGGAGLLFDFPVDFEEQPTEYEDAVITNLFYWNNIIHDVLAHYGFDEAGGNFQATNFGPGGSGNDYVQAEAQDGSGTGNATFGTPPDGLRPRMQMFQWEAPPQLAITAPDEIVSFYVNQQASFGPAFPADPAPASIVPVEDFEGGFPDGAGLGCDIYANEDEVEGNIALVQRGDCEFGVKVLNAQDAGAIGVIVHNCNPDEADCAADNGEDLINMGVGATDPNAITIPSTFIRRSDGLLFVDNAPGVEGYVQLVPINRDSDLDAGVITHEYGHGVSNRLTGGPNTTSCLGNAEQMGEGWSDFLGMMLTMREGDTAEQPRGVGTYVEFQGTDGPGIRPFPYSTDEEINPTSYDDIKTFAVPHGVGSVWAQMLWEMTWSLLDVYGFDGDIYDGTGGNNIALDLVMTGMTLQPCSPGFVDGRDAILMADEVTNEGANRDLIWAAFAKRGLGFSADQGLSSSVTDGTEAFDMPPPVANEDEASSLPDGFRLSASYPNPFGTASRFTLEVAEAQDVTVAIYDVVGREVARLHDGLLAAGARHGFEVDGRSLASGVYLVRVTGASFAETRRITLLR